MCLAVVILTVANIAANSLQMLFIAAAALRRTFVHVAFFHGNSLPYFNFL